MINVIDQALTRKEQELEDYLTRIDDPQLRQLLSDISALRRTRVLIESTPQTAPSQSVHSQEPNQNGHSALSGSLTQGDATVLILQKAGHPMHLNDIIREMSNYGLKPKKSSLVSNLRKDRRNRFKSMGRNTFGLRDAKASISGKAKSNTGDSPLSRMGFSLIGSIKSLLPKLGSEFSQPIVFKMLKELYPNAAPHIQKASVATTLRKLADDGLLEVTYKGYGSEPRRYRRK